MKHLGVQNNFTYVHFHFHDWFTIRILILVKAQVVFFIHIKVDFLMKHYEVVINVPSVWCYRISIVEIPALNFLRLPNCFKNNERTFYHGCTYIYSVQIAHVTNMIDVGLQLVASQTEICAIVRLHIKSNPSNNICLQFGNSSIRILKPVWGILNTKFAIAVILMF